MMMAHEVAQKAGAENTTERESSKCTPENDEHKQRHNSERLPRPWVRRRRGGPPSRRGW